MPTVRMTLGRAAGCWWNMSGHLLLSRPGAALRDGRAVGRAGRHVPAVGARHLHARPRADAREAPAHHARDVLPQPAARDAGTGDGDARAVPDVPGRTLPRGRPGPEPAAPGPVDDDPSADPVHRLLLAGGAVRDRD